ncbi:MAG TPA: Gfo/Idh/MocA family oxidoreductase [Roseiflexaceae bacterium]|nr:Gfo/Idh/MocA family oxidoreductase [Roseiflexaceae bacterium]
MPDRVRVGVIGTSWYADLMHLPALVSHPHVELRAICGRNREQAEVMARKYGIPQIYTDYRALIEQSAIDALVIAVPDDLHYPITMQALDTGLHVLCEKPLALSATHARAMYEKAEAVGVKHMTYFTWRWVAPHRYAHALVEQGYLGRAFHAGIRYVGGHGRTADYTWRRDRQHSNGSLGDLGSHAIDLARWYVGDISRVSCHIAHAIERSGPAGTPLDPSGDAAMLVVEFTNGAQGTIQVSDIAYVADRIQEQRIVLHGTGGTLEVDMTYIDTEVRGARDGEQHIRPLPIPAELWGSAPPAASFHQQLLAPFTSLPVGTRAFIDAIRHDLPITPSFYDGWQAQEVIDAARRSHETGQWVNIPGDTQAAS